MLTLCMLDNFSYAFDVVSIKIFKKCIQEHYQLECQFFTVWIQIKTYVLSVLICLQKYQQTTKDASSKERE